MPPGLSGSPGGTRGHPENARRLPQDSIYKTPWDFPTLPEAPRAILRMPGGPAGPPRGASGGRRMLVSTASGGLEPICNKELSEQARRSEDSMPGPPRFVFTRSRARRTTSTKYVPFPKSWIMPSTTGSSGRKSNRCMVDLYSGQAPHEGARSYQGFRLWIGDVKVSGAGQPKGPVPP
jgi:hypothetical protein